ncbi:MULTISPECIES: transporter substrate-binding domain-containing protein [Kordiimonas]|uniref:transporter substrate-binding domain-containing protein n=1 Tax=Kordiimonas TaxID=288021 RepID=UPI00257ADCBF|nr:transporter substrate-binding domain-containing protein [Kordiimonas sp. UBA4487]
MRQISAFLYLFALSVFLMGQEASKAEEGGNTLVFQFEDHPPFLEKTPEGIGGSFGKFVNAAAAQAGIGLIWQERAFRRTRRDLEEGKQPFCVAGHSYDADRAPKFHYTPAIGTFGRSGLLVRTADIQKFEALSSVQALFETTDLAGGFIAEAKYAVPFRPYLANSRGKHLFVSTSHENLVQLLVRGRIDFLFENEMMAPLHRAATAGGEALGFVSLPDMPKARKAYVMCTQAVDPGLLARLDAAIEAAADVRH